MNTKGIILGICSVCGLSSCEQFEIDGLLEDFGLGFNTDYYETEFVIPPSIQGTEIDLTTLMQSDMQEQLTANGYPNATVTGVQLIEARIEITDPSIVRNLNALEFVNASLSTENLPEELIATCRNDQENADALPMETPGTNIKEYIMTDEYFVDIQGRFKESTSDTLIIKGLMKYRISLTVSNLQ